MIQTLWGLSPQTKLLAAAVAIFMTYGAFKINNYYHQSIGAQKLENKLIGDDTKTLKEKVKRDVRIRSEDDDALLNRFDD